MFDQKKKKKEMPQEQQASYSRWEKEKSISQQNNISFYVINIALKGNSSNHKRKLWMAYKSMITIDIKLDKRIINTLFSLGEDFLKDMIVTR